MIGVAQVARDGSCFRTRRIEALTRDADGNILLPRSPSRVGGLQHLSSIPSHLTIIPPHQMSNPVSNLDRVVKEIADEMRQRPDRGEVASYIPELARVDDKAFGLVVIDAEGNVAAGGDADTPFSIQSISKVFTLTLALGKVGDRLWRRVGREPSGSAFNSIVQLEVERGIPRNPFINAGAIAVTDLILSGHKPREALGEILRFMRFLAQDTTITIDEAVAASEQRTGFRNAALANYMKSFGVLENPVDYTLGVYFHHCAIAMSCRQLATAGRFLAHLGRDPSTGFSVVQPERARRINAVMLTCGHYDGSGEFAYRVGLPGKSGVGGGILAIAPGKASIAVWSPGLDASGNSHLGRIALEALTKRMGWSIFGV
jgi:glutaminase